MGIGSYGTLSMNVSSGAVGDTVTISNAGTGFWGTMVVTSNGVVATTVTLLADNSLSFVIPVGASTGPVIVTNPDGEAGSAGTFTIAGDTWDNRNGSSCLIGMAVAI